MRKKYIFGKKLYISVLTSILVLLTTVATTFAWVGVFANSTFESFNIGIKASSLEEYNVEISDRPMVIAANKMDAMNEVERETVIEMLKEEFNPKGIEVFAVSAVTGEGVKELLWHLFKLVQEAPKDIVEFETEFIPVNEVSDEPYTIEIDPKNEHVFIVEGPKLEKMLGYTNLESEKGFAFFQKFLKQNGILKELEALGIGEGDTVRMYGFSFEYYK